MTEEGKNMLRDLLAIAGEQVGAPPPDSSDAGEEELLIAVLLVLLGLSSTHRTLIDTLFDLTSRQQDAIDKLKGDTPRVH